MHAKRNRHQTGLAAHARERSGSDAVPGRGHLLGALALAVSALAAPAAADELYRPVMATPDAPAAWPTAYPSAEIQSFYETRRFAPIWIEAGAASGRARALLEVLRRADEDGLDASDYSVARIAALIDEGTPDALAEMEPLLSAAVLRYARDVSNGRLAPQTFDARHASYPREVSATALLHGLAEAADPAEEVGAPGPDNVIYAGLRRALAAYREIAAAGGWPVVPDGDKLELGDRGRRVALLRQRLAVTGDAGPATDADVFDDELDAAVRTFQRRHGLAVDGVVGRKTLAALNVPVETRIRQLIVNMERARWLPDELGRRHVLVNIAGFEAWVVDDGRPSLRLKAIVGKSYQQTPAFSERMTYLVLNPYWNVPPGITRRETIPAVTADPTYLAAHDMEVVAGWDADAAVLDPATIDWQAVTQGRFPYRFRQRPGPQNALGRVKFMLPNGHNVYIHDTPARELFERPVRAFSHGCIRVAQPLELAAHLLAGQDGWSRARIDRLIASGQETFVPLAEPVPVHVSYFTAWSDDGEVNFRDDVYDRDTRLDEALLAAPPESPSA